MTTQSLNIYQKLIKVREKAIYLKKDTDGFGYKYASGSSVIASVRQEMDIQKLILIPNMESYSPIEIEVMGKDKSTKKLRGAEIVMSYEWVDADNPADRIKTQMTFVDDKGGCQGIGAVLTYAERYFLCKFFQIATDKDDPDKFKKKHDLYEEEQENIESWQLEICDIFKKHPSIQSRVFTFLPKQERPFSWKDVPKKLHPFIVKACVEEESKKEQVPEQEIAQEFV